MGLGVCALDFISESHYRVSITWQESQYLTCMLLARMREAKAPGPQLHTQAHLERQIKFKIQCKPGEACM